MNGNLRVLITVAVVIIIAASGVEIAHYVQNQGKNSRNSLEPVYNVSVTEPNGTSQSFNLSSVGGYAYVPAEDNGAWHLNKTLSRIVSFIPSVTATLYALHAYSRVVGVDQYSTYPTPTKNVSVFNLDVGNIPIESIANLTPDVIITTTGGFSTQQINQVVNVLHIPYLVLDPGSISQIEVQNSILGYLTGTAHNASLVNSWMNSNLQNLSNDLKNIQAGSEKSVFYYLGPYDGGIITAGNGTFVNSELTVAHLKNIISESGYPEVSSSSVINASPDYVLLDQYYNETNLKQYIPGLNATRNSHVIAIPNDNFFTEPNFRIVYSIYWLAGQFYPGSVNLTYVTGFNNYTHLNLMQNPEAGVNS